MGFIKEKKITLKNGKSVTFRTALKKDSRDLINFQKGIMQEHYYTISDADEWKMSVKKKKQKIQNYRNSLGKIYLTAVFNNRVVGMVTFQNWTTRKTQHCGWMSSMFVKKSWRNKGIGKVLIQELLIWANLNPIIEKVCLAVFSSSTNAISLYKKMGFKFEGRCRREIKFADGKYADSILMYKFVK